MGTGRHTRSIDGPLPPPSVGAVVSRKTRNLAGNKDGPAALTSFVPCPSTSNPTFRDGHHNEEPSRGGLAWGADIHMTLIRSRLNFTTTFLAVRHELPAK